MAAPVAATSSSPRREGCYSRSMSYKQQHQDESPHMTAGRSSHKRDKRLTICNSMVCKNRTGEIQAPFFPTMSTLSCVIESLRGSLNPQTLISNLHPQTPNLKPETTEPNLGAISTSHTKPLQSKSRSREAARCRICVGQPRLDFSRAMSGMTSNYILKGFMRVL